MKIHWTAVLLIALEAHAFVAPWARPAAFGVSSTLTNTRSCATLFSEATDSAGVDEAAGTIASDTIDKPNDEAEDVDESNAQNDEEKFSVYVSNIPFAIEDKELEELFSECGNVKSLNIPRRRESADSRGFAFVEMSTKEEMEKAVEILDGRELSGRSISVAMSLPKDELQQKEKPIKGGRGTQDPKIYIGNLPYGVAENDIMEHFSSHGEVVDVFIARDESGQDRGFGFVTMGSEDAVDAAIAACDGSFFQGRRLAARRPLPEGNKNQRGPSGSEVERLYFGNLSYDTTVETMRELFEQHGTVLNLFITEDFATRQSRGYGFAQVLKEDAKRMMEALNGIEIDGRSIRVTAAEDKVDRMRIYCGNFAFEATADSIRSLFEEFGQVFSIYFPEDRQFGGSRGFAILTMEKESGEKAIKALNGREVDGREIRVNEAKPKGGSAKKSLRLYIGNLDFDTTTETLREAFSEYGEVKDCFLPQDKEYGGSRGFGFVTMDADDAKVAIDELDGIELDGRVIRVVEATGSSKKQGGATEEDGEYDEE